MSPVKIVPSFLILLALFCVCINIALYEKKWYDGFSYFIDVSARETKPFQGSPALKDFQRDWIRERQHRVDWRGLIRPCKGQMGWGQTKPGWGKQNRSNAATSTISLWDIRPAGEFSKFLIQSRTADGRAKTIGGDWWRVYLRGPSSRTATIFDHSNGSYEALFLIMEPGVYRVLIHLDYSLCDGLKDPPRDWFIRGNAQGTYQKDELLGTLDDYLLQDFTNGATLNITIPPTRLHSTIEDRLQSLNSPCGSYCRFLWDGFGRWVNNKWKPFLKQSFKWNASKLPQSDGTFWAHGDSLAERFLVSVKYRPLCRQLYNGCNYSKNGIYPIVDNNRAAHSNDLDFDRLRVINYMRQILNRPELQTPNSTLLLNFGLHFVQAVNFTTFQAVLYDIVELLRETDTTRTGRKAPRYKAKVVWKTTTAIRKEKAPQLYLTAKRFLTAQRVYLFSMYAASAMCQAGYEVLDVYPLTDSFPGGTVGDIDIVHYTSRVFRPVAQLLEKHRVDPYELEADLTKTRVTRCTGWETQS